MTDELEFTRNSWALLNLRRLPARLNSEQTAPVLGVQAHDIPTLVKWGLLLPLGSGPRNSVKYFSAAEIEQLSRDRRWLDKVTKALRRGKTTVSDNKAKFRRSTARGKATAGSTYGKNKPQLGKPHFVGEPHGSPVASAITQTP
jgi:hypothetical protein